MTMFAAIANDNSRHDDHDDKHDDNDDANDVDSHSHVLLPWISLQIRQAPIPLEFSLIFQSTMYP